MVYLTLSRKKNRSPSSLGRVHNSSCGSLATIQKKMLTATLSVSRSGLRCADVVRTLQQLGVACDVTANTTLLPVGDGVRRENGCRIVMGQVANKQEVERVWETLRKEHALDCAHGKIQGEASGCVFDLFGATRCPG